MIEPNIYAQSHPVGDDWDKWTDGFHDVKLRISDAAKKSLRKIPRREENLHEFVVAFDRISRKWFAIRHFPCFIDSFDCMCAAQAQELSSKDDVPIWEDVEFPDEPEPEPEPEEDEDEEEDMGGQLG